MSGEDPVSDPTETLEIQNVVASTGIGQELDLQTVASDLAGVDYWSVNRQVKDIAVSI